MKNELIEENKTELVIYESQDGNIKLDVSYATFNRRILGDATGEMGPFSSINYNSNLKDRTIGSWYQDEAWSLFPEVPWVTRGFSFSFGDGTGIFSFAHDKGSASAGYGYRIVLAF